jgi:hypothetical protein
VSFFLFFSLCAYCTRCFGQPWQRANPALFKRQAAATVSCVAAGGQDGAISVWMTNATRPLMVLHAAFQNTVTDMAWEPRGLPRVENKIK